MQIEKSETDKYQFVYIDSLELSKFSSSQNLIKCKCVKYLNWWTVWLIQIQEFKIIQVTSNHEATQICKLERKIDSKVVFNIHFLFIQMSNLKFLLKTAATHTSTHIYTQSNIKTLIPWDSLNGNNDYISCLSEIFYPNPYNMHSNACWISNLPANITWRLNTNFM